MFQIEKLVVCSNRTMFLQKLDIINSHSKFNTLLNFIPNRVLNLVKGLLLSGYKNFNTELFYLLSVRYENVPKYS